MPIKNILYAFIALLLSQSLNANDIEIKLLPATGHKITEKEEISLETILQEEKLYFLQGDETGFIGPDIQHVTAKKAELDYDENEVSADQKYFNKKLQVSGTIEAIKSGLGNEPYILLEGVNKFKSPQIRFERPNIEKISALRKQEEANFICIGDGAVMGTPMFKECVFSDDYANNKINNLKENVRSHLKGERNLDRKIMELSVLTIHVARLIPEDAECLKNNEPCLDILATLALEMNKIKMIANELKEKNIDIDEDLFK